LENFANRGYLADLSIKMGKPLRVDYKGEFWNCRVQTGAAHAKTIKDGIPSETRIQA